MHVCGVSQKGQMFSIACSRWRTQCDPDFCVKLRQAVSSIQMCVAQGPPAFVPTPPFNIAALWTDVNLTGQLKLMFPLSPETKPAVCSVSPSGLFQSVSVSIQTEVSSSFEDRTPKAPHGNKDSSFNLFQCFVYSTSKVLRVIDFLWSHICVCQLCRSFKVSGSVLEVVSEMV